MAAESVLGRSSLVVSSTSDNRVLLDRPAAAAAPPPRAARVAGGGAAGPGAGCGCCPVDCERGREGGEGGRGREGGGEGSAAIGPESIAEVGAGLIAHRQRRLPRRKRQRRLPQRRRRRRRRLLLLLLWRRRSRCHPWPAHRRRSRGWRWAHCHAPLLRSHRRERRRVPQRRRQRRWLGPRLRTHGRKIIGHTAVRY